MARFPDTQPPSATPDRAKVTRGTPTIQDIDFDPKKCFRPGLRGALGVIDRINPDIGDSQQGLAGDPVRANLETVVGYVQKLGGLAVNIENGTATSAEVVEVLIQGGLDYATTCRGLKLPKGMLPKAEADILWKSRDKMVDLFVAHVATLDNKQLGELAAKFLTLRNNNIHFESFGGHQLHREFSLLMSKLHAVVTSKIVA